jgi:hypothetical protein
MEYQKSASLDLACERLSSEYQFLTNYSQRLSQSPQVVANKHDASKYTNAHQLVQHFSADICEAAFVLIFRDLESFAMKSTVPRKIEPELLGVADAEAMTGRSRWTWRRDCYSGAIASVKIGRRLFIPLSEVRRVIGENTRPRLDPKR